MTVNVNGVVPDWPSALLAVSAAIESVASSLRIVLVAVAGPRVAPVLGLDRVTVKASLASTVVSPATLTVIVLLVWPAAKVTVPRSEERRVGKDRGTGAPPTAQ